MHAWIEISLGRYMTPRLLRSVDNITYGTIVLWREQLWLVDANRGYNIQIVDRMIGKAQGLSSTLCPNDTTLSIGFGLFINRPQPPTWKMDAATWP